MSTPGTPILRSAYQPLAYTVATVDLDFHLDPQATRVTSRGRIGISINAGMPDNSMMRPDCSAL